jgi:hypothetical protein
MMDDRVIIMCQDVERVGTRWGCGLGHVGWEGVGIRGWEKP